MRVETGRRSGSARSARSCSRDASSSCSPYDWTAGTAGRIAGRVVGVNEGDEGVPLLNRTVLPICSIEVSPYGDLLDEQKGSAAGRAAQGRAGRTHHECARSEGAEVERTAVPTTEEALPGGRRPRPAPRPARAAR